LFGIPFRDIPPMVQRLFQDGCGSFGTTAK
jgi:hypothetical protein